MPYVGKKATNAVDVAESQSLTVDGDLTVDTNTLKVDSTNNRVGIGTTSPTQALHVEGTISYDGQLRPISTNCNGSESVPAIPVGFDFDSGFFRADTDTIGITTGGSERMRINSSGNVGIGIVNPAAKLHVNDTTDIDMDSTASGQLKITGGASTYNGAIALNDVGMQIYHNSGSRALIFGTNETERMRITSDGKVGIGDTTPGSPLEVKGSAADSTYVLTVFHDGNSSACRGMEIIAGTDDNSGSNPHIDFRDGNGTFVGRISSTGSTVTYGPFTAMHPCILPDADNDSGYPYGTLLETTSLSYTQKNGADTERGLIYNVRKTQSANSKAVLGAYGSSENADEEFTNRHQVLVLGDGHILCNNSGGNISVGDGICSSAAAGIGQKATANPSMIIGIAQEDVTFANDTETKLVAVQYGLQQFVPWS